MLLTLLVLAPLFSQLPKPVLGALIIEAVVMGMMDLPGDAAASTASSGSTSGSRSPRIVGTLVFGVLAGVMIGIGAVAALAGRGRDPARRCRPSGASRAPRSSAT